MITMDSVRAASWLLVASTCLLALGACTHASTPRAATNAPPLRYTHATGHNVLHFELTNTWARSQELHGIQGEAGFVFPHQAATFLRERADGEWGDIEEGFIEPVLARNKLKVPRDGQVQVVVQWFGNEPLQGEPLRACLELSDMRRICSGPFVVERVPGA